MKKSDKFDGSDDDDDTPLQSDSNGFTNDRDDSSVKKNCLILTNNRHQDHDMHINCVISDTAICEGETFENHVKNSTKEQQSIAEQPGRRSLRLRGKRPKMIEITTSDEEDFNADSDDNFEVGKEVQDSPQKISLKTPTSKKVKDSKICKGKADEEDQIEFKARKRKKAIKNVNEPKEFSSGAFVVSKDDLHDNSSTPIWRIDGKALLQKFVPFEKDGQSFYRSTSTYSGWTSTRKDEYYPASVELISQDRKETIVIFQKEKIICDDSD